MKRFAVLLTLCAVQCSQASAWALEIENGRIKATPAEIQAIAKYEESGGCVLMTRKALAQVVDMALKAAAATC